MRNRGLHFVAHPDDEGGDGEEKEVEEFGRAVPLAHAAPEERGGGVEAQRDEGRGDDSGQGEGGDGAGREFEESLQKQQGHGPDRDQDFGREVGDGGGGEHGGKGTFYRMKGRSR